MRTLAASIILASAALAGMPGTVAAQETRYQLQRTDDGFARIDTRTGEVSSCRERGDQLVCRMAADERTALMDHIDDLETRIEALEAREPSGAMPTTEDIDQALTLMDRFMRGFVGIVRDMEEPRSGS